MQSSFTPSRYERWVNRSVVDVEARLYAPVDFISAKSEHRHVVCNVMPEGRLLIGAVDMLIPSVIWGLNIRHAVEIHAWMYAMGTTLAAKLQADRVFHNNVQRLVDMAHNPNAPDWSCRRLNRLAAIDTMLADYGAVDFWENQNATETHYYGFTHDDQGV